MSVVVPWVPGVVRSPAWRGVYGERPDGLVPFDDGASDCVCEAFPPGRSQLVREGELVVASDLRVGALLPAFHSGRQGVKVLRDRCSDRGDDLPVLDRFAAEPVVHGHARARAIHLLAASVADSIRDGVPLAARVGVNFCVRDCHRCRLRPAPLCSCRVQRPWVSEGVQPSGDLGARPACRRGWVRVQRTGVAACRRRAYRPRARRRRAAGGVGGSSHAPPDRGCVRDHVSGH